MKLDYKNFDEWLNEIENFSTRRERLLDELGERAIPWLKVAWGLGAIHSELRADGHAAEAAKDARNAGWPEAAEVIHEVTLPESKRIMRLNAISIANEHGISSFDDVI